MSVGDAGIGIDPADGDHIFEVVQRLRGGAIRVESDPGEGSTVSVTLPAVAGGGE